jgi:sialate O-acetylesterase
MIARRVRLSLRNHACLSLAACLAGASLTVTAPCAAAPARPLLDEMFQDHAVLQRDRAIPVWGEA